MGHFFNNFASWSELWTASLWRASWQGAIAVAVVWAIARWRGFLSPRVVCWLWRLVCLKFLLALLWAQPVPLRVLPAAPPAEARATPPVSPKTSAAVAMPVAAPPVAGASEPGDVARPVGVRQAGVDFSVILSLLWLAGVFYAAGRIAKSWNMARRLVASARPVSSEPMREVCRQEARRLGVRRPPPLRVSPLVDSPLLAGSWRPKIVLPATVEGADGGTFDAGELRLMLAHELAHQRRRDLAWNWLPAIVRAAFFFHPLVWLMVRRWSEAQEAACDELLIQRRVAMPVEYGRLLLKLAAREPWPSRSALATAGVLGTFRNLERRIITMSHVRPYSLRRLALAAGIFWVIAAAGLIPWRLAPQTAAVAVAADEKPESATQPDALPGKIYVWVHLDLSSDVPFPHNYHGVIEVDPNTGGWRKVGSLLGQTMRLSPDGRRVAFSEHKAHWTRDGVRGGTSELFVADLQDPQPVKLMEDASLRAWSPDGQRLLYHANEGGPGFGGSARTSQGSHRTTWSLDLATKEKQKLPIPETEQVENWTSHGNWLVTISGRHTAEKNGYQLYLMHPDGTDERRITQDRSANLYPRFSPDGRQIAYQRSTLTEHGLWVIDVDGSNARQILAEEEKGTNIGGLCWSPDGRSLAIQVAENISDREQRKMRLEIVALDGGERRVLELKDVTVIHFMQAPEWR